MRITQGTFSFLPDLTDAQITAQIDYCLDKGWAIGIEYTDDPHPRNTYWEMFGNPMFDVRDAAAILMEVNACRATFPQPLHPGHRLRFDARHRIGRAVLHRQPAEAEPGFRLIRTEEAGRTVRYSIESYAVQARPEGARY
jgi:ribulose-bisphosphate carboxylase small chain